MNNIDPNRTGLKEAEVKILETRVDELIDLCRRLKEETRLLRRQQADLLAERAKLARKTDLARSQVESMIMRLRVMEQGS